MATNGRLAAACSRTRGRLTHAFIAGALAVLAFTSVAHAAPFYGVNVGTAMNQPPEQRDHLLDVMAASGVTVARQDAAWITVEPKAPDAGGHHYDWRSSDRVAATLAAHGLTWYPTLDYSAPWASTVPGDPNSAPRPETLPDYAAYAAAFAQRYGPNGAFWAEHPELPTLPVAAYELGNEPNSAHFWHEQATAPEVYADEYVAARAAIKAVDAKTPVVSAGLADPDAMNPSVFVRRMVKRRPSLRTGLDAVGYHPYQMSYAAMRYGIARLRNTLKSLRMASVPIEVTEVGMQTLSVPESVRVSAIGGLAKTLPADRQLKVSRLIVFEWASAHQGSDWGTYLGIMNLDGSPTPTGTAYLKAIRANQRASHSQRARRAKAAARKARARRRAAARARR